MDQEKRIKRLKELSDYVGGNAALGKMLGYDSGAFIGQLLSGHRRVSEKFIEKVNSVHKIKGWFDKDIKTSAIINKPYNEDIEVPLLSAASIGYGEEQYSVDAIGSISLKQAFVTENLSPITSPDNLRFIHAYGDSMEPTFSSGDILLIDVGVKAPNIDGIYALEAHNRLFIKRVTQNMRGEFLITSDNPKVKTADVLNGDYQVTIHGRVVWSWTGKKH